MSIDIGGSGLKAMLLDPAGKPVSERQRVVTPAVPTPEAVLAGLDQLRKLMGHFDRVSVGFPGVVKHGCTYGAFNLHPSVGGRLPAPGRTRKALEEARPRRQRRRCAGYGAIKGHGVELVLTLGTGMGSALFTNGHLCPRPRTRPPPLAQKGHDLRGLHRPPRPRQVRQEARWNDFLEQPSSRPKPPSTGTTSTSAAATPRRSLFTPAPTSSIVSNETGILGGVALWRERDIQS
jgi:polyphosphate glucokinase